MQNARDYLIAVYLEYLNDYVSLDTFAEHNGLHREQAESLVVLARNVYNSDHPDK